MPIWSPAFFGSGAGGASGYTIEDAIYLDGGADYLVRDPSSAGNRKTFTFSCWLKRSALGSQGGTAGNNIFGGDRASGSGHSDRLMFGTADDGNDYLEASFHDGTSGHVRTSALYRDPTAWMHVVWVVDTDQGGSYTASNTVKIYVNGVAQTFSSTSYPAEDYETAINNTENQTIGVRAGTLTQQHFGGYIAEVILLDGTAVSDASDFGELNGEGVWVPKNPSGLTFGTNGFHLDFKVAPGTGNGAGTDVSGNGNHFTDNSMTTAQQVTDTCTDNAASNIGNYVTWSSIDKDSNVTLSQGNTVAEQDSTSSFKSVLATQAIPSTGKWVWEIKQSGGNPFGGYATTGVASTNVARSIGRSGSGAITFDVNGSNLRKFGGGSTESTHATGVSISSGEAFQFAVDSDAEQLEIYINNTKQGSSVDISSLTKPYKIISQLYSGGTVDHTLVANSADFENNVPTGYKTINTANLPSPTVKDPDDGFVFITLENGNTIEASLATARSGFGSFIDVFKREDGTDEDYDVRFSDDSGNSMHFNTNAAAGSEATLASGVNYSAWSWRVGATYGCYTAEISHTNGSATNQAHGLGSGAKSAVAKRSDSTGDWYVSHPNMSSANIRWNVQDRPSTTELVTVDGTNITLNSSFASGTYRVIVWEQIDGFSAFTGYDHNGSTTDGPYINLGGSASLIAWRNIDSANANDFFATFPSYSTNGNGNPADIRYNWNNGEKGFSGITIGDVTANGFKMRPSSGSGFGKDDGDPMLVWAWGLRPFGGDGVAQARAR
jgi:hypothetical protein